MSDLQQAIGALELAAPPTFSDAEIERLAGSPGAPQTLLRQSTICVRIDDGALEAAAQNPMLGPSASPAACNSRIRLPDGRCL
jgi:hypothetical protein